MIKTLLTGVILCIIFSSCRKIEYDLGLISSKYDVSFYRPPLMNQIGYFVSIDGGQKTAISGAEGSSCSAAGLLHYSLSMGTHTVTINGNSYILILSKNGATLNGKPLQLQSCNNGLSVVISSMFR